MAGTLVNNHVRSGIDSSDPALASVPPSLLASLDNPQTLVSSGLLESLTAAFAGVPDGPARLANALDVLRGSLADGIALAFLFGAGITALSVGVLLFLPEVALRGARTAIPADPLAPEGVSGRGTLSPSETPRP